jgi:hypothetical protein
MARPDKGGPAETLMEYGVVYGVLEVRVVRHDYRVLDAKDFYTTLDVLAGYEV